MNKIYLKLTYGYDLTLNSVPRRQIKELARDFDEVKPDVLYSVESDIYNVQQLKDEFLSAGAFGSSEGDITLLDEIEAYLLGKELQPDRVIPAQDPDPEYTKTFDSIITMDIAKAVQIKLDEFDKNTGFLVETGSYTFESREYSTSIYAQQNIESDRVDYIAGILTNASPDQPFSLKDGSTHMLECSKIPSFYAGMKSVIKGATGWVTLGQQLREDVLAIEGNGIEAIQAVSDIKDTRL
jgi:hypothetical protein